MKYLLFFIFLLSGCANLSSYCVGIVDDNTAVEVCKTLGNYTCIAVLCHQEWVDYENYELNETICITQDISCTNKIIEEFKKYDEWSKK